MSPSPRSALLPLLPPSFPCSFALVASLPPCSFRPSSSPLPRYPHSRATLHRVPARHLPCETRLSNRRSIFSVGPCEIAALATTRTAVPLSDRLAWPAVRESSKPPLPPASKLTLQSRRWRDRWARRHKGTESAAGSKRARLPIRWQIGRASWREGG